MIASPEVAQAVAAALLRSGAVEFHFERHRVFASGKKAPVYLDNRKSHGDPQQLRVIATRAVAAIRSLGWGGVAQFASTATGAIPLAAVIAYELSISCPPGVGHFWVLKEGKDHGNPSLIQGKEPVPGADVLVIEDHSSTGRSTAHTIEQVRRAKAVVVGCFAVTTYEGPDVERTFSDLEVPWFALTTGQIILAQAVTLGMLTTEQHADVQLWFDDYAAWAAKHGYAA